MKPNAEAGCGRVVASSSRKPANNAGEAQAAENGGNLETRSAAEYRTEGNQCFAKEDWRRAIALYTKSISCVTTASSDSHAPEGGAVENGGGPLVLAFSNRAEAWLRVGESGKALEDTLEALEINEKHENTLVRKARAFIGLNKYAEAISCLEDVLKLDTPYVAKQRHEIEATLKTARVAQKQTEFGIYELDAYLLQLCGVADRVGPPPDCRDYIGPVEVKVVPGASIRGMGRGLFVTKDVKEGELLLVSNALAVSECKSAKDTGGNEREASGKLSPVLEKLVKRLACAAKERPHVLCQLYKLQDGAPRSDVPPLSMFRHGLSCSDFQKSVTAEGGDAGPSVKSTSTGAHGCDEGHRMSLSRIRQIVKRNALEGNLVTSAFGYQLDYKANPLDLRSTTGQMQLRSGHCPLSSTTRAAPTRPGATLGKPCSSRLLVSSKQVLRSPLPPTTSPRRCRHGRRMRSGGSFTASAPGASWKGTSTPRFQGCPFWRG